VIVSVSSVIGIVYISYTKGKEKSIVIVIDKKLLVLFKIGTLIVYTIFIVSCTFLLTYKCILYGVRGGKHSFGPFGVKVSALAGSRKGTRRRVRHQIKCRSSRSF